MEDLEVWFKELITTFRDKVSKLTPDQIKRISNLDDFSFPCQVDVFWFKNAQLQLDYQFILIQHFEERADLEICIHNIPFHQAIETLGSVLEDEKWNHRLGEEPFLFMENGERTYRKILEGHFLSVVERIKRCVINQAFYEKMMPVSYSSKTYVTSNSSAWFVIGMINVIEQKEIIDSIIGKNVLEIPKQAFELDRSKVSGKPKLKGFGTYFYPPIWIGEVPKRSFKEKAQGVVLPKTQEQYIGEYKGYKVVIQQNGLITIVNDRKKDTLDMLNEIMGVALNLELPCHAIRESELGEILIDSETLNILGSTISLVSDRNRQANPLNANDPIMISPTTFLLPKDDVIQLLGRTERITKGNKIAKSLIFLLESYTHLAFAEYLQGFIMGWTVVERYIDILWDELLKDKHIPNNRNKKLTQGLFWTTDIIIESLNLTGAINISIYERLMNLKSKRNKILHVGETVTKADAEDCFSFAMELIQNTLQTMGELKPLHVETRLLGVRS